MYQELTLTTIKGILDYNKLMKAHILMWSNQGQSLIGFSENELAPFVIKTLNVRPDFIPPETQNFVVKVNDLTKFSKVILEKPETTKLYMDLNEMYRPNLFAKEMVLYSNKSPVDLIPAFDFPRFNDLYYNAYMDWHNSYKVFECNDISQRPELESILNSKSSDGIIRTVVDGRAFYVPQPFLNVLKKDTVSLSLLENFNNVRTYLGCFEIKKAKGVIENIYFRSVKLDNM